MKKAAEELLALLQAHRSREGVSSARVEAAGSDEQRVRNGMAELDSRVKLAAECHESRTLRLQQLQSLRVCENDTRRALEWLREMCEMLRARRAELGWNPIETERLLRRHEEFMIKAQVRFFVRSPIGFHLLYSMYSYISD